MADTITAVFHYGDDETITKTYSVLDYINSIDKNAANYDETTLALIHSIADYGHYSQPFLSAANNWTVGEDHAEMSKVYTERYLLTNCEFKKKANDIFTLLCYNSYMFR